MRKIVLMATLLTMFVTTELLGAMITCTNANKQSACNSNYPNTNCTTWECAYPGSTYDCFCSQCQSGYTSIGLGGCVTCSAYSSSYANCNTSWTGWTSHSSTVEKRTRGVKVCNTNEALCRTETVYRCKTNHYGTVFMESATVPTCTPCPSNSYCPNGICLCTVGDTCGDGACICNSGFMTQGNTCLKDACDNGYYGPNRSNCTRCPSVTKTDGTTLYGVHPGSSYCDTGSRTVSDCCYISPGATLMDSTGEFGFDQWCAAS